MANEYFDPVRVKKRFRNSILKSCPLIGDELLSRLVDDLYLWYSVHQREMTESEFNLILVRHGLCQKEED